MNTKKLNEWLQIVASLGVLVGLLIVAYEVRQTTYVAKAEHTRAAYSMWIDLSGIELEADLDRAIITAIENPEQLTSRDKFKISSWLTAVVSVYDYSALASDLSDYSPLAVIQEEDAQLYFASEYARLWFESNKRWITPPTAEVISRVIEKTPVPTTWDEAIGIHSDADN